MNKKAARKIRKTIIDKPTEVLLLVRKEYGKQTEEMGARQIYQRCKKLYYAGKFKV